MTHNELKNTNRYLIEAEIRRDMTIETEPQYQEMVEAAANILYQQKQVYYQIYISAVIFQIKK